MLFLFWRILISVNLSQSFLRLVFFSILSNSFSCCWRLPFVTTNMSSWYANFVVIFGAFGLLFFEPSPACPWGHRIHLKIGMCLLRDFPVYWIYNLIVCFHMSEFGFKHILDQFSRKKYCPCGFFVRRCKLLPILWSYRWFSFGSYVFFV